MIDRPTLRVDPQTTASKRASWLHSVRATAAAAAFAVSGLAVAEGEPAATAPASLEHPAVAQSLPHASGGTLEHRVKVLAKALDLDSRQQAELENILEGQRRAVAKIWSIDAALSPAERVPATRAVENRTANQIRGILNDEQKKRYNAPKPQGADPEPNVSQWMQAQTLHRE